MKTILNTYFSHFSDKRFVWSFVFSLILLIVSLFVNFYTSLYATRVASSSVTDIILSNIRAYDIDVFFVFGGIALVLFIAIISLAQPKKIPFILKSIALFILIRSIFITLTHIGPFPVEASISGSTLYYANEILGKNILNAFFSGNDLFFSGHTGLPFLMALVFWDNKILRYIMIATSVFFGVVVLMGHLHYTIDVVAAFFITYSIYSLAKVFFKNDKIMFDEDNIIIKPQLY